MTLHEEVSSQEILSRYVSPELGDAGDSGSGIDMPPLPLTLSVSTYVVRPGDALSSIAARHGVSLDALISMNGISDARRIQAGTRLRIPNISGIVHVVARGESVGSVAARYGVGATAVLDANDLGSSVIRPGQSLFIPGARMSATELKKALGELVAWPVRGALSSLFGYRPNPFTGIRQFHNAIDIVAPEGTPVKAAMDGRVADTGYNAIYGNYVILTHPEGYQTLYAHLSKVSVKRGTAVRQGVALGAVGTTGYSTGPHLHFSVFKRGSAVDPLKLLK
jgi:murein DD-endopeptidase MepM/ murein hydrolase activator NlpD